MKSILVNATHKEEMRVAILEGSELQDLNIESSHQKQLKGNIYKAVAARVERGLNAVFVDYGEPKHGFLPFKQIARDCYKNTEPSSETEIPNRGFVKEEQELLVQLNRGEIGSKGALLSTFIRIPGRFLVLMPNSTWGGMRITKHAREKHRTRIRDIFSNFEHEPNEGIILRTAGIERSKEELLWDLNNLRNLWQEISRLARTQEAPSLIYREGNVVIHTLRDHMGPDVEKIVFDNPAVYAEARRYMASAMPGQVDKVMLHDGDSPLFSSYGIEAKIATAFEREINLPQGGEIVFDQTEALLSIDINSAKSTRGTNIEATALSTNVEAAKEIALQLRMRDTGGLIIIDFIDMASEKDREVVEEAMRRAMKYDRAHNQIGYISSFGLLEMSRQRLRTSLHDSSHLACPRCNGSGWIRTIESNALEVLRSIVRKAMQEHIVSVVAKLPVATISYLLNEKRHEVDAVEAQHNISLFLIPDPSLENPNFEISGFRANQPTGAFKSDYVASSSQSAELDYAQHYVAAPGQSEVVSGGASSRQKSDVKTASKQSGGFFHRLFRNLIPSSTKQDKRRKNLPEESVQYPEAALTGHRTGETAYKNRERQISDSAGRPIRGRPRTSYERRRSAFPTRHDSEVDSPVKTERKHLQRPASNQRNLHENQNTGHRNQYSTARSTDYSGTRRKTHRRPKRTTEDDYFSGRELLPSEDTQTQREVVQTESAPRHESMRSREQHESARPARQYGTVGAGRQHRAARPPRQREPIRTDRQRESARPERQRDPANSESAVRHGPVRTERSHEPIGMDWQRTLNPGGRRQATRQRRRYGQENSDQRGAGRPGTTPRSLAKESGNSMVGTPSFENVDRQQTDGQMGSFGAVDRTETVTDSAEFHTADLAKAKAASPAELRVAYLAEKRETDSAEARDADPAEARDADPAETKTTKPNTENYPQKNSTFVRTASHHKQIETAVDE